jgi:hypothetical protein
MKINFFVCFFWINQIASDNNFKFPIRFGRDVSLSGVSKNFPFLGAKCQFHQHFYERFRKKVKRATFV